MRIVFIYIHIIKLILYIKSALLAGTFGKDILILFYPLFISFLVISLMCSVVQEKSLKVMLKSLLSTCIGMMPRRDARMLTKPSSAMRSFEAVEVPCSVTQVFSIALAMVWLTRGLPTAPAALTWASY